MSAVDLVGAGTGVSEAGAVEGVVVEQASKGKDARAFMATLSQPKLAVIPTPSTRSDPDSRVHVSFGPLPTLPRRKCC